jgi:prepilin-type N-terminal cleavage/methylation domain-containing protein
LPRTFLENVGKMKRVRLSSQLRKAFRGSSRGFTLIEVLIALALMGIIAIAFLSALTTSSAAFIVADERATSESLARSQMEYVKNQDYIDYSDPDRDPQDYDVLAVYPEGYAIEVVAEPIDPDTGEPYNEGEGAFERDDGIQNITVTVSHNDKVIITMEGYKVDR